MPTKLFTALTCLILGIAGSACSSHSTVTNANAAMQTIHLYASWAIMYHDLPSLKQGSDLGIDGTIERVIQVSSVAADKDHQSPVVFTDYAVRVQRVLWNPQHLAITPGTTITLHQTGGMIGNTRYEVDDDPLFDLQEHAILFLHMYQPQALAAQAGASSSPMGW